MKLSVLLHIITFYFLWLWHETTILLHPALVQHTITQNKERDEIDSWNFTQKQLKFTHL